MRGNFLRSTRAALLACALCSAGSSFAAEDAKKPAAQGQPGTAPAAQAAAPAYTQPMKLTEDKLKSLLDAIDDLRALGPEGARFSATNPNVVKAMQFSDKTTGIIKKHGFSDTAEFRHVAFNAAAAYYVNQNGGKEALKKKMAEADVKRAEAMEKLKQHLTPEQMKMLEVQIASGTASMRSISEQPDQNLALVKKHSDRMRGKAKAEK